MIRSRLIAAAFGLLLSAQGALAASTVNPAIPAQGSPLQSAPIRGNFQAAANDINNILSMFAGNSAPASPVTFQQWANPAVNPAPIALYDGTTFVQIGFLDRIAHSYSPVLGSGSILASSPITVSFSAGVATIGFDLTVSNTFLAPQTDQGASTTSPGWYAQLAGDTVPRVRVGLNATDIPSIAFGPGNAARDSFIERIGAASLRFGAPDAASPVAQTLSVQNVVAGTSNIAGANLTINGSRGTGTGVGGSIIFQVAPAGSSGTTQNPLSTALTIFGDTGITTGSATDKGAGTFNAAGLLYSSGNAAAISASSPLVLNATTGNLTCSTCVTGTAGALTAGTTATSGYTSGQILGSTGSVLSVYSVNGSGNVVLTTSPTLVTPVLGVAVGTSLALGGATIGANALAVTGTSLFNSAITYGGVTLSNSVTGTGSMVLSTSPTLTTAALTSPTLTTPVLGVATGTSLALGGASIGSNALAITGTANFSGTLTVPSLTSSSPIQVLNGAAAQGMQIGSLCINSTYGSCAPATNGLAVLGATTLSAALTYGGVTLSNSVTGTGSMVLGTSPSISSLTVTTAFTATGLVTFADLVTGSQDTVIGYWGSTTASALAINNCSNALTYSTSTHTFGCNASAGTGTVTSITPGGGIVSAVSSSCSQSAITASGTLYAAHCINPQTGTSYTFVDGDRAKLVTASNASAQAYTLPQAGAASAFQSGWYTIVKNINTGTVTITPTTSTINGASTLVLLPGQSAEIVSDGINYQLTVGIGQSLANSLGADVTMNNGNLTTYFSGPVVAQGTIGSWAAGGTVTVQDTASSVRFNCKLWDGTTVFASTESLTVSANSQLAMPLFGFISNPAGNIRIDCSSNSTTSKMIFNATGFSKDSTVTALRLQ